MVIIGIIILKMTYKPTCNHKSSCLVIILILGKRWSIILQKS